MFITINENKSDRKLPTTTTKLQDPINLGQAYIDLGEVNHVFLNFISFPTNLRQLGNITTQEQTVEKKS